LGDSSVLFYIGSENFDLKWIIKGIRPEILMLDNVQSPKKLSVFLPDNSPLLRRKARHSDYQKSIGQIKTILLIPHFCNTLDTVRQ